RAGGGAGGSVSAHWGRRRRGGGAINAPWTAWVSVKGTIGSTAHVTFAWLSHNGEEAIATPVAPPYPRPTRSRRRFAPLPVATMRIPSNTVKAPTTAQIPGSSPRKVRATIIVSSGPVPRAVGYTTPRSAFEYPVCRTSE